MYRVAIQSSTFSCRSVALDNIHAILWRFECFSCQYTRPAIFFKTNSHSLLLHQPDNLWTLFASHSAAIFQLSDMVKDYGIPFHLVFAFQPRVRHHQTHNITATKIRTWPKRKQQPSTLYILYNPARFLNLASAGIRNYKFSQSSFDGK